MRNSKIEKSVFVYYTAQLAADMNTIYWAFSNLSNVHILWKQGPAHHYFSNLQNKDYFLHQIDGREISTHNAFMYSICFYRLGII